MRIFALVVALLPVALISATDDTQAFVDHFHDDANASAYVAMIDQLIDAGETKVYASMEAEKQEAKLPQVKTSNGILMLYTVTHTPAGVLMHFSVSRAPYLPTAFGKHIVGLFMARSGWPKPAVFQVSEHQVFHAMWVVPETQFAELQPALPALRAKIRSSEDAPKAFMRGLLRASELEGKAGLPPQPTAPAALKP